MRQTLIKSRLGQLVKDAARIKDEFYSWAAYVESLDGIRPCRFRLPNGKLINTTPSAFKILDDWTGNSNTKIYAKETAYFIPYHVIMIDIDAHNDEPDADLLADEIERLIPGTYRCGSNRGVHLYLKVEKSHIDYTKYLKEIGNFLTAIRQAGNFKAEIEIKGINTFFRIPTFIPLDAEYQTSNANNYFTLPVWNIWSLLNRFKSVSPKSPKLPTPQYKKPFKTAAPLGENLLSENAHTRRCSAANYYLNANGDVGDIDAFLDFYEKHTACDSLRDEKRVRTCTQALKWANETRNTKTTKSEIELLNGDDEINRVLAETNIYTIRNYIPAQKVSEHTLQRFQYGVKLAWQYVKADIKIGKETPIDSIAATLSRIYGYTQGTARNWASSLLKFLLDIKLITIIKDYSHIEHRARKFAIRTGRAGPNQTEFDLQLSGLKTDSIADNKGKVDCFSYDTCDKNQPETPAIVQKGFKPPNRPPETPINMDELIEELEAIR